MSSLQVLANTNRTPLHRMRAPDLDDASCPGGDSNDEIYDGGDIEMRML